MKKLIVIALVVVGLYLWQTGYFGSNVSLSRVIEIVLPKDTTQYSGPDNLADFQHAIQIQSSINLTIVTVGTKLCLSCEKQNLMTQTLHDSGYNIGIIKLDYNDYPSIARYYKKPGEVPQSYIYYQSKNLANFTGAKSKADLVALLQKVAKDNTISLSKGF